MHHIIESMKVTWHGHGLASYRVWLLGCLSFRCLYILFKPLHCLPLPLQGALKCPLDLIPHLQQKTVGSMG